MHYKKIVFFSGVLLLGVISCKKTIDNIKEDLMVNLITSHTWKVVKFMDGTSNLTTEYAVYDFNFEKDKTVKAILNGNVQATGTWIGDETSKSITASFPTGAGTTLNRLTGQWIVTNTKSLPWRVFSNRFEGSKQLILDLQEK